MLAKTIFYAFVVVALAAIWSTEALPLAADDVTSPANVKENFDSETSSEKVVQKQESEQQQTKGTDASVQQTDVTESSPKVQQPGNTEEVTVGSAIPVVGTDPALPEVSSAKTESDVSTTATIVEQTDSVANSPSSDVKPNPSVPIQGQTSKPYYTGGVHTVKLGPNVPFFLDFFKPFQSFQPFISNQQEPLFRHQLILSGAPINPFANAMNVQPFNQMVEAYTNEFRSMLESFDKMSLPPMENLGTMQEGSNKPVTTSKTQIIDGHIVQTNETTFSEGNENYKKFYHIQEIQVLPEGINKQTLNEKQISMTNENSEMQNVETNQIKPTSSVTKQNYDNRKNFVKKTPANPVSLDDHFQTAAASYYTPYAPLYGSRQQPAGLMQQKQYHGSYQTPNQGFHPALNQGYYPAPNQGYYPAPNQGYYPAPNQGFYPVPNQVPYPIHNHGSHPSQPPISLHGDTLVNELVAAQQQSSGGTVLPLDVEFVDVNGKPQPSGQYHHYNNHINNNIINDNGNRGHEKFSGRKY